jgi:hypothetical protein
MLARKMFPKQPPMYVAVTKLIGAYACNKGTALGLARDIEAEKSQPLPLNLTIAGLKKRRKVYTDIAAKIYCDIPAWGRSFILPEKGEK